MKTSNYLFLLKSFRLLLEYQPWKLLLLFFLTLLLGTSQGFSIALLIPFLQLLEVGEGAGSNALVDFFTGFSNRTGIPITFETVLLAYLILLTLIALLVYGKSLFQAAYQQDFSYQIRRRLFRKIILSDWTSLNSKSRHNHLQVLTEEVPKLTDYYYFYLQILTRIIITAAHLFYAFLVSARFTTLVVVTGLVAFVLMRGFLRRSARLGDQFVGSFNRLLKYIDDFWVTVKIAKVHNSERFYYDKFDRANQDILKLQYRLTRNYALPQLLYKLAGIVVLVAVIYLGYRVEQVPLASFFILIVLFARIFPQFAGINSELSYIFADIASVKMVLKLDETFEERGFPEVKHEDALKVKTEIRIEDLHFAYPKAEPLFEGFSASIQANRITGIVGESGRGKTTLIDLIAGLQKPRAGQILVDGKRLDNSLLPAWKSSIGYLPQDAFFIDGSIRENLVWDSGKDIADDEIWKVLRQVNVDELIKRQASGLDTELANYAYYFSGGERQRLALARVLLRKPRLLILDEATSSLDAENEKRIMETIAQLKKNITILFITHRESVYPWFDQMIRL